MAELRENEQRTLLALKKLGKRGSIDQIVKVSGLAHAAVMRASLSLKEKKLTEVHEQKQTVVVLNEEGEHHAEMGLPERRLINSLLRLGGEASIEDVFKEASLEEKFFSVGLGWLRRKGWVTLKERKLMALKDPLKGVDERLLSLLNEKGPLIVEKLNEELQKAFSVLKRRRLVYSNEKILRELELTDVGWGLVKKGVEIIEEISQLTPELIVTGNWRKVKLRKYDIKAPVANAWPGKKHPYKKFLDELKRKLVSLGFKEMTGSIVELMFFNFDGLYTPQDHPAREIFDIYFVKSPTYGNVESYNSFIKNVKKTHENGWKTGSKGWDYRFSIQQTKRLVLRAHGTALSVRTLLSKDLEIPGKYFSIVRCYRPDVADKTHLPEFNQVEGVVIGEGLTLRDLLGILKKFAIEIAGADKVRFKPDYFPFTEPSVEISAYKEGYGWVEFGGSGIFRPEVTLPLGIDVPVIAWGLGVDRLFMMKAKIDDIRYLFTKDLDWIRRKELV